jgi:hypothetical protein
VGGLLVGNTGLEGPDHAMHEHSSYMLKSEDDSDITRKKSSVLDSEVYGTNESHYEEAKTQLALHRGRKMMCILQAHAKMSMVRRQYAALTAVTGHLHIPIAFSFFHDPQLHALQAHFRVFLAKRSMQANAEKRLLLKSILKRFLSQ